MTPAICKGLCLRYKVKNSMFANNRYILGQKRCQSCTIYIKYEGRFCPCCGTRLRTRSRIKKTTLLTPIKFNIKRLKNG